ncbi:MAG: DMT family protein [Candidatus Eremiobacteraeota bacterium]|nr:DMT family protein [Candidatus Eremiobacteraeota bacterium]
MAPLVDRYPVWATIVLLVFSNIFMTIAWYGHLKHTKSPLLVAIVLSWLIALLEYCFQVPANRIGYSALNLTQLKILQEVITLSVFTVFAYFVFDQVPKWNYAVSYAFIIGAVYFAFKA